MEELTIEKKEICEMDSVIGFGEKVVSEKIFGMVARMSDGHRTFTIGYSNFCITVDAEEIVNMLGKLNGV